MKAGAKAWRWPTGRSQRLLLVAGVALVGCGACSSRDDETYTRSYDTCILKNASHGGDEESRSTATDICARHFTRPATPYEASASATKAKITLAPAPPTTATAPADESNLTDAQVGLGSQGDSISATVRNDDDNIIIKKERIEAFFYTKPRRPDGEFDPATFKSSLTWDFNQDVVPGDAETLTGNFGEGHPPTPYYSAHARVTVVLPHSERAKTNNLKEVP